MPTVVTEITIPNIDVESVWNVVSELDKYPQTMPNVLSVEFQERSEKTAISSWKVMLNDSELTWIERDSFEPFTRLSFESIEGDLEVFRGEWILEQTGPDVHVRFEVEFDLGIPSLAEVLDPVGADALKENSLSMLTALRNQLS